MPLVLDAAISGDGQHDFTTYQAFSSVQVQLLSPGVGARRPDTASDHWVGSGWWSVGFDSSDAGVQGWTEPNFVNFDLQFWELTLPVFGDAWRYIRWHFSPSQTAHIWVYT